MPIVNLSCFYENKQNLKNYLKTSISIFWPKFWCVSTQKLIKIHNTRLKTVWIFLPNFPAWHKCEPLWSETAQNESSKSTLPQDKGKRQRPQNRCRRSRSSCVNVPNSDCCQMKPTEKNVFWKFWTLLSIVFVSTQNSKRTWKSFPVLNLKDFF